MSLRPKKKSEQKKIDAKLKTKNMQIESKYKKEIFKYEKSLFSYLKIPFFINFYMQKWNRNIQEANINNLLNIIASWCKITFQALNH